jgi:hypothetical protein
MNHCDGTFCEEVEHEQGFCSAKRGLECCGAAPTHKEAADLAELNHPDHKCIFQRVKEAETHEAATAEIDSFLRGQGRSVMARTACLQTPICFRVNDFGVWYYDSLVEGWYLVGNNLEYMIAELAKDPDNVDHYVETTQPTLQELRERHGYRMMQIPSTEQTSWQTRRRKYMADVVNAARRMAVPTRVYRGGGQGGK